MRSIPAEHPYVRSIHVGPATVLLADPCRPWWPPPALEPAWIRARRHEMDLVHLHFGFEGASVEGLRAWCATLEAIGCPLVLTVHDLRNPHLADNALHLAQLGELVPAATTVLTLTPGAAGEIRRRWGRQASVVAHPHLVPLDLTPAPAPAASSTEPGLVGVHLKSVRRNCVPPAALVAALAPAVGAAGGRLEVRIHDDAPAAVRAELRERCRRLVAEGMPVELLVGPRLDDDELWRWLGRLHAAVLPYRFGTHSGWLEACRDLGTRVLAPDCGYYRDQWADVELWPVGPDGTPAAASLQRAVSRVLGAPPLPPVDRGWRRDQAARHRACHLRAYREAIRRVRGRQP